MAQDPNKGKEYLILISSGAFGTGAYFLSKIVLERLVSDVRKLHEDLKTKQNKSGVDDSEDLINAEYITGKLLLCEPFIPLSAMVIGCASTIVAYVVSPDTVSELWTSILEPKCYYGLSAVVGITGISVYQDYSFFNAMSTALGAYMIGFGAQSLIPSQLTSLWDNRLTTPLDVLFSLANACLVAAGFKCISKPSQVGKRTFGVGLILLSGYYISPEFMRNLMRVSLSRWL